jgi:hypothetical protein
MHNTYILYWQKICPNILGKVLNFDLFFLNRLLHRKVKNGSSEMNNNFST